MRLDTVLGPDEAVVKQKNQPRMPRSIVKKPNDRLKFLLSAESNSNEFANQLSQYPQPLISLRLVSVTEI
jgi:hypothetical protein